MNKVPFEAYSKTRTGKKTTKKYRHDKIICPDCGCTFRPNNKRERKCYQCSEG